MTTDEVLDILCKVISPQIGIDIIDLGPVCNMDSNDHLLNVEMTMTTAACPPGACITEQANMLLRQFFPDAEGDVNLIWHPRWTPEMMSDAARQQLGWM